MSMLQVYSFGRILYTAIILNYLPYESIVAAAAAAVVVVVVVVVVTRKSGIYSQSSVDQTTQRVRRA